VLNLLLYLAFVAAFFLTVLGGRPAFVYACAALMPATRAMPVPVPLIGTPSNLIVIGLLAARTHWRTRKALMPGPLPLKRAILFMTATVLLGVAVRGIGELAGTSYIIEFGEVVRSSWYWLTGFVIFAAVYRLAGDPAVAKGTLLACQLSMAGECAITIWETIRYGRTTAHLAEPNAAGSYFAAAAALFFNAFLWGKGPRRWLYALGWLVAVNAVFNSLSRGGMLAAILACGSTFLVYFLFAKSRSGFKIFVVIAIVLIVVNFALFVPAKVQERVLSTFGHDTEEGGEQLDVSSQERLEYWAIAWELFREQPWGYGAFTFPQYLRSLSWRDEAKQAHNVYLEVLVELGAQGFLAMMVLLVTVWATLWRAFRRASDDEGRGWCMGLFGWWTAHVAAHMFGNPFFLIQLCGQFWMMAACVLAMDRTAHGAGTSRLAG